MSIQKISYPKGRLPKLGQTEADLLEQLLCALDRNHYLESIGFTPFVWQADVLRDPAKRKVLLASRQAGKSTVVSAIPAHTAKYYPKSVSLILAPTQTQAELNMQKLKEFIRLDPNYPKTTRDSDSLIELENGSRIYVVTASDRAARGYSKPKCIIMDEASRIEDIVYISGIRPMLTDNHECELIILSTPFGKDGFFYKAFNASYWKRYFVRTPFAPLLDAQIPTVYQLSTEALLDVKSYYASKGVSFYISDRHLRGGLEEANENYQEMGNHDYQQEYMCEFVSPADNVFSYDDIEKMFSQEEYSELALYSQEVKEESTPEGFDFMQNIANLVKGNN